MATLLQQIVILNNELVLWAEYLKTKTNKIVPKNSATKWGQSF